MAVHNGQSEPFSVAQQVAEVLIELPNTRAVLLTGSLLEVEGSAAEDIDLLLVADTPPPQWEIIHKRLEEKFGIIHPEDSPGAPGRVKCAGWWIHGVKGWEMDLIERLMTGALQGELTNGGPSMICDAIVRCRSLVDPTCLIPSWQERLGEYPQVLRHNVIIEGLWALVNRGRQLHHAICKEDSIFALMVQGVFVEQVLQIIYAVNRTWYPGPKRQGSRLLNLNLLPDSIFQDLDRLSSGLEGRDSSPIHLSHLHGFMAKIFAWVDTHCPDLQVNFQWLKGSSELL
jgi:hypothetical protein